MKILDRILPWLFAAVFAYASVLKLRDPAQFGIELDNYRLLPAAWIQSAAYFVPMLELVVAIGLVITPLRLGAWLLSIALGAAFTFFVSAAWARGLDITCGCFGSSSSHVGLLTTARAAGILLVATLGFWRAARRN